MPPTIQETCFNIGQEIGLSKQLPNTRVLFERQYQPEFPFDELVRCDEFRTRIVLNEPVDNYDQDFLRFLYGMLSTIDSQINARTDITSVHQKPEGGCRAFGRCFTEDEVELQQENYIAGLKETIGWLPKNMPSVIGLPMMGALSIRRQLERDESFDGKLFDLPIFGSSGTKTGEAVAGNIPEELLDHDALGFFADDVLDTSVSLTLWALARYRYRLEHGGTDRLDSSVYSNRESFLQRVRDARDGNLSLGERDELWQEVADLVWGENIIVTTLYGKNASLSDALLHKTVEALNSGDRREEEKAKAQLSVLSRSV